MRWESKKPLWPTVAALGLLSILAIAAPRAWQSLGNRQHTSTMSQSAGSPQSESLQAKLQPEATPVPASDPAPPHIALPSLPPAPTRATDSLPIRRNFNLATLISIRDRLLALVDQIPDSEIPDLEEPESTPASRSILVRPRTTPTVRVSSENDRLAMVPRRETATRQAPTPEPSPSSESLASDFAALLLEAANSTTPTVSLPTPSPRLAMVPTLADPATPKPTTRKPELRKPDNAVQRPNISQADLSPAEVTPTEERPSLAAAPRVQAPSIQPPSIQSRAIAPPTVQPITLQPPPIRHRPQALIKQLQEFSAGSPGAVWSQHVLTNLRHLTDEDVPNRPDATDTLDRLEQLYSAGLEHSENNATGTYDAELQQASQALGRRLLLWRVLVSPEHPRVIEPSPATVALLPSLSIVSGRLEQAENGNEWHEYLLLDRIAELTSDGIEPPTLARAKLAQEILSRMKDPELTESQLEFLSSWELVQLKQAMLPWAAGTVNLETLAALIERYESGRETRYAEVIAQLQQRLKWSGDPAMQELAEHLDQQYRGANMRIAMSDLLMNRMLPEQKPIVTPVRERFVGTKVRGRARTTTQLRVRLKPDPAAWHVSLEANGKVYSDTRSDTWPARIRNAARMQYQGRKDISISEQGVETTPAQATALGRNELVGVDSQLDPIPIVGQLLREMARNKHKKARPKANSQAKAKVVRQVKERMDSSLDEKLGNFEQKFRDRVLAPIEELALLAEPLDIHTTTKRAVMQLRLANSGQLAAHTLRPFAPSDSVLSVQMHETAVNNAMMGLGLDGRRMTLVELFEFLTQRFGVTDATPPAEMPHKAIIHFAKRDAVRVQCEGDRLELVLSVAELAHRRDKIKNFQIHVHFRPVLSGLSVRLVRDGSLQFSGRRLKTGPRVVLHSILGKILAEDQQYTLVSSKLMLDPRFAGLMVTQLVLEDGWIGIAVGPAHARRTAWRAPLPEVLPTPFVR